MKRRLLIFLLVLLTLPAWAEDRLQPKPSQYAPSADLVQQVKYYTAQLKEALSEEEDYDEEVQGQVERNANALVAIGFVLRTHDTEPGYRSGALMRAAAKVAEGSTKFAAAQEALDELVKAANGDEATGAKADANAETDPALLGKAASLSALMQQVPIIDNVLTREIEPARFERQKASSAGHAATLAAIAQAIMNDEDYASDPQAMMQWQALCQEMRDAAAEINAAVHAQDATRAEAGSKKLAKNCDACHKKFRDEH